MLRLENTIGEVFIYYNVWPFLISRYVVMFKLLFFVYMLQTMAQLSGAIGSAGVR